RTKGRDAVDLVIRVGQERHKEGRRPLLLPDGTRIAPGKAGGYKMGGALLATAAQVPVIPIALNAGECWPRRAFLKKPGLVTVSFGPPIPTEGRKAAEVNREVEAWIQAEILVMNPE